MKREFRFSEELEEQLLSQFPHWKFPNYLGETIRWISDNFQLADSTTPWGEPQRQLAYFAYFHPLNVVRMTAVLESLKQVVPEFTSSSILDFGSGLGASELAWTEVFQPPKTWQFLEPSREAQKFHQKVRVHSTFAEWITENSNAKITNETLMASYSLNELKQIPRWFFQFENLIFLEPSTNHHTRKLMELRHRLIQEGYHILAPCTHQQKCPLLTHSKKDWCYDRIFLKSTPWFEKLEAHLPMKNNTLTFSYLVASKKYSATVPERPARVIGDTLKEKGKTRQMICRGEDREFLSWLKKHGTPPQIPHGDLISLEKSLVKKGDELRPE